MKFCDKLQKIRKENNVTQEQLADKLNVSRQAVSKWESGTAYPDTEKLIQISQIFHTSLDELVNDNIDSSKTNVNKKFNFNETFKIIFDFIGKFVNMFWSMSFVQKIKFVFEMAILILALWALAAITKAIIIAALRRIFIFMPDNIFDWFLGVVDALIRILWFILGTVVFVKVLKTRYMDYYIVINDENIEERIVEEPIKELKEKKEYKVVIRDPKDSSFNLLKKIGKVFIFFLKIFAIIIAIPVIVTFITFMILLAISLAYLFGGLFFNGITLALLGTVTFIFLIIWFMYNLIFNQKNAYRRMFLIFIISISLIGIGIGISFASLHDFEIVYDEIELTDDEVVTISMMDNLVVPDIVSLDESVYAISPEYEDIKIEAKTIENLHLDGDAHYIHYGSYDDEDAENNDDNGYYKIVDIYANYDMIKSYDELINGIKHKKINKRIFDDSDNNYQITKVYISSDNLNKIRENYQKLYQK